MALADRLDNPPQTRTGIRCSVGALLAELEGAEHAALVEMLGTPEQPSPWNASQIYDALRDEGLQVGRQSIGRHRGRRCGCAK